MDRGNVQPQTWLHGEVPVGAQCRKAPARAADLNPPFTLGNERLPGGRYRRGENSI